MIIHVSNLHYNRGSRDVKVPREACALNKTPLVNQCTASGLSENPIFLSAQPSGMYFKRIFIISGKMPFLELEIACSGLPFNHVIDPLGPSERGPDDAPYTRYDSIRFQNFFKKIFDFLPDTKVILRPG